MQSLDDHAADGDDHRGDEHEELLLRRFAELGFDKAYRVVFSPHARDLQVVRVIVPRMEFFDESVARLGARLRDHARARARDDALCAGGCSGKDMSCDYEEGFYTYGSLKKTARRSVDDRNRGRRAFVPA